MDLVFAGTDTKTLYQKYRLPLHLYDGLQIARNLAAFQRVMKESGLPGAVCYAAKACGIPKILKIVAQAKAGVDVASEFELRLALNSGLRPSQIVIHGNAKSDGYLEQAVGLQALTVANDQGELDLIESQAKKQNKTTRVLLRLSGFKLDPGTAAGIFTAGVWCKFGEPFDQVPALLTGLRRWPHLDLVGFHVHIGSQITALKPYRIVLGKLMELAGHFQENLGRPVQILDLGGGFPVSYMGKKTWNGLLTSLKKQIRSGNKSIAAWEELTGGFKPLLQGGQWTPGQWSGERFFAPWEKEHLLDRLLKGNVPFRGKSAAVKRVWSQIGNPTLMVEPGRAIVGDAGITLARVSGVRTVTGNHSLVTLEMGIVNHGTGLVEPDLYPWSLANDCQRKDRRPFKAFVAGRLCFSGDMLSRYPVFFPRKPVRGDIAVIEKTGAYAPNFFASTANGFPLPVQVVI